MNILSVENLEKTVKDDVLFTGLTFGLEKGEKIGIVGKNGAGKSTLLKVLASILYPDEGKVSTKSGFDISYLEQNTDYDASETISSFFYKGRSERIKKLKAYKDALLKGDEKEISALYEESERLSLFDIEREYYALLTEFDVPCTKESLIKDLSGGEIKKVAIARTLSSRSGILLLDEPTNHLDIKTIEKMESTLKQSDISAIIVTHDRLMLDSVCTSILELDRSSCFKHPGSYSSYLERKKERLEMAKKQQERMESVLRRELRWLSRAPKARSGKDKGRIERAKELEEEQKKEVYEKKIREFTSEKRRLGKKILELNGISKSFSGKTIFSPFSFEFTKDMKIALVGDNGEGKSTFLDVITENMLPDSGSVEKGVNTIFGYYDQKSRLLDLNKNVLSYINDIGETIDLGNGEKVTSARFLELFGFPQSMHRLPISTLSGGERRRLYLISRLVANPNFLILDEPTNDLDIDTIESLEDYISSFAGPIIISSHDRTFLNIATETTLEIKDGSITYFALPYSEYREIAKERDKKEKAEDKKNVKAEREDKEKTEKKKLSYKEKREYEALSELIDSLEKEIAELEASFSTISARDYSALEEAKKAYDEKNKLLNESFERFLELDERAN